ncbi:MAG: pyruvate kinase [Desulfomicrobium escambiense]|nr:pyruvate kinase [Desulfomicrobium escambiense]
MKNHIKTKIIATIGPNSNSPEKLADLIKAGARVFRVNSSHGTKEFHQANIRLIREIAKNMNEHVAVILDLQGPKIRIGNLKEPIELQTDQEIILKPCPDEEEGIIPIDYAGIVGDVKKGDKLFLDDGKIELRVLSKTTTTVKAKLPEADRLVQEKGLNIPGAALDVPSLTERDIDFIKFGVENDVDYIALSFVRAKNDIVDAKRHLKKLKSDIPVIAKIEKPQALENLDGIVTASDGIMVARGDLGIEISPEFVPLVQKQLIEKANIHRKVVITATQMLESMISPSNSYKSGSQRRCKRNY